MLAHLRTDHSNVKFTKPLHYQMQPIDNCFSSYAQNQSLNRPEDFWITRGKQLSRPQFFSGFWNFPPVYHEEKSGKFQNMEKLVSWKLF